MKATQIFEDLLKRMEWINKLDDWSGFLTILKAKCISARGVTIYVDVQYLNLTSNSIKINKNNIEMLALVVLVGCQSLVVEKIAI